MSDAPSYSFGNPPPFGHPPMAQALGIAPPPTQDPPMINYRGHTLHQSFDMRARMKIAHEKPMIGFWLGAFAEKNFARFVGQAGFDYVALDWEHTPMSVETVVELIKVIQYAGEGRTAVVVRVPTHEHHYTAWVLDAGASAVILPHVETVEQAKKAVENARFPLFGGKRSGPPAALHLGWNDNSHGGIGAFEVFNRAAVILQIESKLGCDNAKEIAAVEGVDGLMLGPGDLAFDLGLQMHEMYTSPQWLECIKKTTTAAREQGNMACLFPSFAPNVRAHIEMGFNMLMTGMDYMVLAQGIRGGLAAGAKDLEAWKAEKEQGKGEGKSNGVEGQ